METGTRTPAPHSTTPRGPRRPPSTHQKGQGLGGEVFPPGAGCGVPGPLVGRAGQAASPCGPHGPPDLLTRQGHTSSTRLPAQPS